MVILFLFFFFWDFCAVWRNFMLCWIDGLMQFVIERFIEFYAGIRLPTNCLMNFLNEDGGILVNHTAS